MIQDESTDVVSDIKEDAFAELGETYRLLQKVRGELHYYQMMSRNAEVLAEQIPRQTLAMERIAAALERIADRSA